MSPPFFHHRRRLLQWSGALALAGLGDGHTHAATDGAASAASSTTVPLQFPRDFGAHPDYRTEWWYLTGHAAAGERHFGFQITFFRSRVPSTQQMQSRLAARQLLFAHAAITDLHSGRLLHDQRIARWNGAPAAARQLRAPHASTEDTDVAIGDWSLRHTAEGYFAQAQTDDFALQLTCRPSPGQPPLLQGDQGFSRKGPLPQQSSWYYSLPQLDVAGSLRIGRERHRLDAGSRTWGKAWLDHEWSNELLDRSAAGWDWIGMNLFDGSALTAFRLRRADGSTLWTGGSFRSADQRLRVFAPGEVRLTAGERWTSPRSGATYPVAWTVDTPSGRFQVRALLDDQELDSRASTGAIYWEGVSALSDPAGAAIGRGYLEMTGYAGTLKVS